MNHWILDDKGEPIPAEAMEWAFWVENSKDRFVHQENIGEIRVSTVFLGLDYDFDGKGPPILWETMVFGGSRDQYQERCSGSREQAEAMHQRAVEMVKESLNLKEHLDYHNTKEDHGKAD